ncbi:MAG: TIGR00730 family Rossman fold protein [Cyclobacteriaceae bacterium]|nr:TIGR00730 family Rossman fold protein [Cyclobacteriaceae bacterium]MDH4296871.1 TIGR00730 family Rossman fold protein [Cyclobacteriaceae bacterium]MDH5249507.1 TIGR00730 family Rossman fold protein [Cyclobacteriaceae bacterium]
MNICVFCGSAAGESPHYAEVARELGKLLAASDHSLVYGGGNIGLMGILADAVLEQGGEVIGVIPEFLLQREVGHRGVSRLEVVNSMHMRKKRMADLSDAFIAMPGGWGTLDELAEILTWRQLGLINQPVGLLNTNNFFDPLLEQMRLMVDAGFLKAIHRNALLVESSAEILLGQLEQAITI